MAKTIKTSSLTTVSLLFTYLPPNSQEEWIDAKLEAAGRLEGPAFSMGEMNARSTDFGDYSNNTQGSRVKRCMAEVGFEYCQPFEGR